MSSNATRAFCCDSEEWAELPDYFFTRAPVSFKRVISVKCDLEPQTPVITRKQPSPSHTDSVLHPSVSLELDCVHEKQKMHLKKHA
jgi:hypothetical protein